MSAYEIFLGVFGMYIGAMVIVATFVLFEDYFNKK